MYKFHKIISGGQTGADMGGLIGAKSCGVMTGGYAPHDYHNENGLNDVSFLKSCNLIALNSSDYPGRTSANVRNSDGTVIFSSNAISPGTRLTRRLCTDFAIPYILNPSSPQDLAWFLLAKNIQTLNVAGNRESKSPGIQSKVSQFIYETLRLLHSYELLEVNNE